ncbi:hypothetical protein F5I97DRAFT_251224 [Phlebopus sp. FC_14]|nr:hypothetical protein F5I97DRAFT_251224 [Phlebopus sp. FC_14]
MPGRPKSGPPYNDPPPATYVVIVNPWGMNPTSRDRGQRDVDRVAAWVELILREANGGGGGRAPRVECVYGMGTRNEVIVQFPLGADVTPLLGEHRWATIARKWDGSPNDPRSSSCFIYNWRNNGDPANHNWTEWYPYPGQVVPAKSPYPAPSWTTPSLTLTNFVLPIPRPPTPPPQPEPESPSISQPVPQQVVKNEDPHDAPLPMKAEPTDEKPLLSENTATQAPSTSDGSLFRPYERPAHYPSQLLNQPQQLSQPAESDFKFSRKHDPYELEDDAIELIRSFKPDPEDEDIKPNLFFDIKQEPDSVKQEDSMQSLEYQPSAALLEAFNSLNQGSGSTSTAFVAPSEPQASRDPRKRPPHASSDSYQPSAEPVDAINDLLQRNSSSSAASHPPRPDTQRRRSKSPTGFQSRLTTLST